MRRGQIDAVYASGPDAVAAVIEAQAARIDELIARVEELERQIGRSSRNSSLPPSRDSPEAREERPKKKGSGRSAGGQPGHRGRHRPMVADPVRVQTYWPSQCAGCGAAVGEADRVAVGDLVAHQVK